MQRCNFKRDWERLLLPGVLLAILAGAGTAVSLWLREDGAGNPAREVIPPVPRYLEMDGLNLFDKRNGIAVEHNPMAFVKKNALLAARSKTPPPKPQPKKNPPKPQPKKAEPKTQPKKAEPAPAAKKAAPVPKARPRDAAPAKAAKPAVPPRTLCLEYTGVYRGLRGGSSAFLEIREGAGQGQAVSVAAGVGDVVADRFTVVEVTEGAVVLKGRDGGTMKVGRGEVRKVEMRE